MKKFDRAVFIFIGLGIWALAVSQFMKPSSGIAAFQTAYGTSKNFCHVYAHNSLTFEKDTFSSLLVEVVN